MTAAACLHTCLQVCLSMQSISDVRVQSLEHSRHAPCLVVEKLSCCEGLVCEQTVWIEYPSRNSAAS